MVSGIKTKRTTKPKRNADLWGLKAKVCVYLLKSLNLMDLAI